jgi:hypothetical protein
MRKNSDDCRDEMKRTAIEFCNGAWARRSRVKVSCFRSFVAAEVVLIAVLALDTQGWAQQQAAGPKVNTIVSEWLAAVGRSERISRVRNLHRTATSDEDGLEARAKNGLRLTSIAKRRLTTFMTSQSRC